MAKKNRPLPKSKARATKADVKKNTSRKVKNKNAANIKVKSEPTDSTQAEDTTTQVQESAQPAAPVTEAPKAPEVHPEETPAADTRTRKAHVPECKCSVCKRKREKAERETTARQEIITAEKQNIINEYLQNLPNDQVMIILEPETIKAIESKWTDVKEKFAAPTLIETGNKLVNAALKFYLNSI